MKTGTFFVRVWRFASILGLIISLFASYVSYPEEVAVRFDEFSRSIQNVDREVLFYSAIGIFLAVYTVTNLVVKLFKKLPTDRIMVPNPQVWAGHRAQLNEIFTNWFFALMAAVNTIVALGLFVLSLLNRSDRTVRPSDYVWLLPMSTAMLVIILAALPIRLFMKPDTDE